MTKNGTPPRLAVQKPVRLLTAEDEARLLDRGRAADPAVERAVASVLADVRARGDDALREQTLRYDGVRLDALEVPAEAGVAALEALDPGVRAALEEAAANIAAFHRAQLPPPLEVEVRPGVRLGRRSEPLRRVGVYAPGGRASYPSSVLMGVVPARVAGVDEVIVCSPPGPDGLPPPAVLAACTIAGADRAFAIGGAGAIAALAYGTATVPRVDKVVGPGNAYVTEAKRQLNGIVAIDCPAGPSEVLVIADATADPELVALELIAQAEHDPDAAAVLIAVSATIAEAAVAALARLLPAQPRREITEAALAARGAVLVAESLDEAIRFANRYAPEHLSLMVEDPRGALERVRAAGTIFLGASSCVAFGDYTSGANHVLPTAGRARAYSGLSAVDFLRFSTYQEISAEGAAALAGPTATLADAEGLPGHAAAARARAGGQTDEQSDERWTDGRSARRTTAVPYRDAYRDIELYDPGRAPVAVDLSDNTSRFGPPPASRRALAGLGPDALTRYPAVFADGLKEILAELHGVAPENVTTGCGSDDVIDSAFRAFCEPGDVVAYPEPTFGMVPIFARMNAARPRPAPLGPGLELDPDAILAARARITYLCRPNNPTGTLFERSAIERITELASGLVLVDEAYADFSGDSMVNWAIDSGRAVVLRTLSKAWGLAGLRIGYAIGPAPLIREIEKSRGPYKVTAAADAAARAALAEDRDWVRDVVARTVEHRDRLRAELERRGLRVWPSAANFLLFAPPGAAGAVGAVESRASGSCASGSCMSARWLAGALRERGVLVRAFPALPGLGDAVRVSIGPWPMLESFLSALDDVLAGSCAPGAAGAPSIGSEGRAVEVLR